MSLIYLRDCPIQTINESFSAYKAALNFIEEHPVLYLSKGIDTRVISIPSDIKGFRIISKEPRRRIFKRYDFLLVLITIIMMLTTGYHLLVLSIAFLIWLCVFIFFKMNWVEACLELQSGEDLVIGLYEDTWKIIEGYLD